MSSVIEMGKWNPRAMSRQRLVLEKICLLLRRERITFRSTHLHTQSLIANSDGLQPNNVLARSSFRSP